MVIKGGRKDKKVKNPWSRDSYESEALGVEECPAENVSDKLTISSFSGESENTDIGPGGKSYVSLEP